ncbi:MAG: NfeD family protein [Leptospiraceae bacterium]|nr:NfeD family protein [Leptospiraceae bacterium]
MGGFSYVVWFILGLALIVLEPVVPGLVIIFLGFGALLTGVVVFFDLIPGLAGQVFFWLISSGLLIALLREQVRKIFPSLEKSEGSDESEYLDREVEVISLVDGQSDRGRVRFMGTTWKARCENPSEQIPSGSYAKIAGRDNLTLIVYGAPKES